MEIKSIRYLQPPALVAQECGDLPLSSTNTEQWLLHSSAQTNTNPKFILPSHRAQQNPRASMGNCPGVASRKYLGWTRILRTLLQTKEVTHRGWVKNRPMGQCLWDNRRNSLLQMERKVWRCWGTNLSKALQKHQEGPGAEGHCMASTLHPSHPSSLSVQGWIHKGSELTELEQDQTHGANRKKLKSS